MKKTDPALPPTGQDPRVSLLQFSRFLFAGLVNTAAGFFLFLFFYSALQLHYLLSNFLVFVSWVWFGFELQRRFVFRSRRSLSAFSRYLLNQTAFILLATLILWILVELAKIGPELAYVVTLSVITLGIYASSRVFVFRQRREVLKDETAPVS